jgi:endonuclease/exonuclease/phosphatase family metal-dependent hydrolase
MLLSRRSLLGAIGAGLLVGCQGRRARSTSMKIATYNVSLHAGRAGELIERLRGKDAQAQAVAQVLRQVRPDIVLLNEFDFDGGGEAADLFAASYLADPALAGAPLVYPYRYLAPVNTGVASGLDINADGKVEGGEDCWGFGLYPGQYGMLVLSRFPIDLTRARSFQLLPWHVMPQARRPRWPDGRPFQSDAVWQQLRLSSKSHWDLPIATPVGEIHLLASHPTPPAFDGPERRNRDRNHDEIRFWADYITPAKAAWMTDDQGRPGGLDDHARFVILGDLNADPNDGNASDGIRLLLEHPRVNAITPRSEGGRLAAERAGGSNAGQRGDPAADTGAFDSERGPGHLRADYVLPSNDLPLADSGIHWPLDGESGAQWVTASDHRLVWVRVG